MNYITDETLISEFENIICDEQSRELILEFIEFSKKVVKFLENRLDQREKLLALASQNIINNNQILIDDFEDFLNNLSDEQVEFIEDLDANMQGYNVNYMIYLKEDFCENKGEFGIFTISINSNYKVTKSFENLTEEGKKIGLMFLDIFFQEYYKDDIEYFFN